MDINIYNTLDFLNNHTIKRCILIEVGKMWDFTHFWYLFCVILHIFHTWIHNYGAKVLKNKQGNKLPHVLYITYNQLYHIPGI